MADIKTTKCKKCKNIIQYSGWSVPRYCSNCLNDQNQEKRHKEMMDLEKAKMKQERELQSVRPASQEQTFSSSSSHASAGVPNTSSQGVAEAKKGGFSFKGCLIIVVLLIALAVGIGSLFSTKKSAPASDTTGTVNSAAPTSGSKPKERSKPQAAPNHSANQIEVDGLRIELLEKVRQTKGWVEGKDAPEGKIFVSVKLHITNTSDEAKEVRNGMFNLLVEGNFYGISYYGGEREHFTKKELQPNESVDAILTYCPKETDTDLSIGYQTDRSKVIPLKF